MILPDVNVLIYAHRRDATDHSLFRDWLDLVVNGESRYGMSELVVASAIRIITNRRAFKNPTSLPDALAFAETVLEQPACRPVRPGPRHFEIFVRLCRETSARGPLVPDAYFAALAIEHGCEWVTCDRDFARFKGLRWRHPFA